MCSKWKASIKAFWRWPCWFKRNWTLHWHLHRSTCQCYPWHCTTFHCTALHCILIYWIALHCTALHLTALQFTALKCTVPMCTEPHCSTVQDKKQWHPFPLHHSYQSICTALPCIAIYSTALYQKRLWRDVLIIWVMAICVHRIMYPNTFCHNVLHQIAWDCFIL